jgi:hypothetical protein
MPACFFLRNTIEKTPWYGARYPVLDNDASTRPPRKRGAFGTLICNSCSWVSALNLWQRKQDELTEPPESIPGSGLPDPKGTEDVAGCMDPTSLNYNPNATLPCDDLPLYMQTVPAVHDPKAQ